MLRHPRRPLRAVTLGASLAAALLLGALSGPVRAQDTLGIIPDAEDAVLHFSSPGEAPDEYDDAIAAVSERARSALVEMVLSCTVREGATLDDVTRTWGYTRREDFHRWIQKRGRLVEIRVHPATTMVEVEMGLSVADLQGQVGHGVAYSAAEIRAVATSATPDTDILSAPGAGIRPITLRATARCRIPPHLRGKDAGIGIAHDGAMEEARAMLKSRLMEMEYAKGARVASYLVLRPMSEAHITAFLAQLKPVEQSFGEEYIEVTLALPLEQLSRVLPVGDVAGSALDVPAPTSLRPDGTPKVRGAPHRSEAASLWPGLVLVERGAGSGDPEAANLQAIGAARSAIVQAVRRLTVPDGRTVGELVALDDALLRSIMGMVASADVVSVTPTADGGLEAVVQFRPSVLQTDVLQVIERHKPRQTSSPLVASIGTGEETPAAAPATDPAATP